MRKVKEKTKNRIGIMRTVTTRRCNAGSSVPSPAPLVLRPECVPFSFSESSSEVPKKFPVHESRSSED